jgi:hypothetical protein
MNKFKAILAVLVLLLFVGAYGVWRQRPVPVPIRLDLTGTPGLRVTGTLIVDGNASRFEGILPTSVEVTAQSFEYKIAMQEPKGKLIGHLTVANGVYGSSGAENDFGGVHGTYAHHWWSKGGGFTNTRKGE